MTIHLLALSNLSFAATPPNSVVTNTATASYTIGGTPIASTGSVTITTAARTPSKIELLQYIPSGSTGTTQPVETTQCNAAPLAAPTYIMPPALTLAVPSALQLALATEYRGNDPIFIKVTDYDQNVSALVAETISVTIASQNGDSEVIRLKETGLSTGIFTGYIQSNPSAVGINNCSLNIIANQKSRPLMLTHLMPYLA